MIPWNDPDSYDTDPPTLLEQIGPLPIIFFAFVLALKITAGVWLPPFEALLVALEALK